MEHCGESRSKSDSDHPSLHQMTPRATSGQSSRDEHIKLLQFLASVRGLRNGNPGSILPSMGLDGISVSAPDLNHSILRATEVDVSSHRENDCNLDTPLNSSSQKRTDVTAKPYSCTECPSRFESKEGLRQHDRFHSGTCPRCCLCGKRFLNKSSLEAHLRSHTGERPYSCLTCGKSFSRKNHLKTHELIHTGEKPHRCSICGKSFRMTSDLRRHMVVHTGQKPHTCNICGKSFSQKCHLREHIVVHTAQKAHVRKHLPVHVGGEQNSPSGKSHPR